MTHDIPKPKVKPSLCWKAVQIETVHMYFWILIFQHKISSKYSEEGTQDNYILNTNRYNTSKWWSVNKYFIFQNVHKAIRVNNCYKDKVIEYSKYGKNKEKEDIIVECWNKMGFSQIAVKKQMVPH